MIGWSSFALVDAKWCDGLNGWVLIIRPIHPAAAAAAAITIAIPIAVAVAITITSSTWASRGRKFQNGNVYSL